MAFRYVVTGPPGAGKSSYVRERAQLDDLVWDFDVIVPAIAAQRTRVHQERLPRHILDAMRAMREGLLGYLAGADLEDRAVFIIATNPQHAAAIARRIDAAVITLP